jgi:CDP-diacylglycerol--glycerol-3-phosphate 3-phosphatidyltransferase
MLGATAALCGGSLVAYALLRRAPDSDAEHKGAQFVLGGGNFFVHWFLWVLTPLTALALRFGLTPDFFNVAGLVSGALAGLLIGQGQLEWGGWAIAIGGVADILDGRIARARGVVSDYGKFIDSTLDRFVEVMVLLGFVFALRGLPGGALAGAAALAGSLLVSYARARGESVGVVCKGGLMQRAERLVLLCLAALSDGALTAWLARPRGSAALVVLSLIAALTLMTAVQRTLWIGARLRERERTGG